MDQTVLPLRGARPIDKCGVSEFRDGFRWDAVELLVYKNEGDAPFDGITRQILHHDSNLACELRFFDIEEGGYSTLERHEHVHGVMILRGCGECMVGDEVRPVNSYDLVTIPPMTWHQFRANAGSPLGFLCMVNKDRDKPQLPTDSDLALMGANPRISAFLESCRA